MWIVALIGIKVSIAPEGFDYNQPTIELKQKALY